MHILIVDDNPQVHNLLSLMLRPLKIVSMHALDGREALEMAVATMPGLIILDMSMPNMDGLLMLEQLAAQPETANIPVIIYSAISYVTHKQAYSWPAQVIARLNKVGTSAEKMRELVQSSLNAQ